GGGVRLSPESAVTQAQYFLALDARDDPRRPTREAVVHIASAIEVEWLQELFPNSIRHDRSVTWDEPRQRAVALRRTFYRDLLLHEDQSGSVDPDEAAKVLADAIAPRAMQIFSADEDAVAWLARLQLLRQAMPEHPWPK